MSKMKFLMGATALVAAAASAQVTSQVYAGGSSLIGPYLRQAYDCYGAHTPLVIKGSALNNPTDASPAVTFFNYTGTPAQDCATTQVDNTFQLNYISTGSGTGLKGLFTHDAKDFWGDTLPPGGNNSAYPSVDSANAETAMQSGDITVYNSGGVDPATGLTFANPASPPTSYPIPEPLYGPLIQIPLLITPVDITYDPTYRKIRNADGTITSYHFNIHRPRADGSGGLVLDAVTYCKIFNGQITDWNQIPTSLNGGVSLQDEAETDTGVAFSVPMVLVGRSDSSGTTSVFTRHMAAQCPSQISGTVYPDFSSTLPTAVYNASWTKTNPNFGSGSGVTDVPGKFTGASGSDGVADYVHFDPNNIPASTAGATVTQGRLGYVGPDFALPAVLVTGNNLFGLNTASLIRPGTTTALSPTGANAKLAYINNILPPSGQAASSDPTNWVQTPFKTAAIAIPTIKAYPIVGTSNLLTYTCFADATVKTKWVAFLNWFETNHTVTDARKGLLASAGFAPMPAVWRSAINRAFSAPSATTKPYNLYILQAGTGPATGTGSQCHAITPGA